VKPLLLFRGAYIGLLLASSLLLVRHFVQRSAWNKERLYQELLSGNESQQLRAASALVQLGGQQQLLDALKEGKPEARSVAKKALEYLWFNTAGPEAFHLAQSASDAADKQRFDEAIALLDRIVKQFPNFAEAWNQRACIYWQMGQYEKSIADSRRALDLNPNHYGALQGLGVCWLKLGDVKEACRCLRDALKILPHDDATREALKQCEGLLRKRPLLKPDPTIQLI
jgi:tetratricopeptide (TPR) repeat protein